MMRILRGPALSLLLACTTAPLYAADEKDQDAGAGASASNTNTVDAKEQRPAKTPPRSMEKFVPREKIPADSAISFPVDI
jgi:hypothetical protein